MSFITYINKYADKYSLKFLKNKLKKRQTLVTITCALEINFTIGGSYKRCTPISDIWKTAPWCFVRSPNEWYDNFLIARSASVTLLERPTKDTALDAETMRKLAGDTPEPMYGACLLDIICMLKIYLQSVLFFCITNVTEQFYKQETRLTDVTTECILPDASPVRPAAFIDCPQRPRFHHCLSWLLPRMNPSTLSRGNEGVSKPIVTSFNYEVLGIPPRNDVAAIAEVPR